MTGIIIQGNTYNNFTITHTFNGGYSTTTTKPISYTHGCFPVKYPLVTEISYLDDKAKLVEPFLINEESYGLLLDTDFILKFYMERGISRVNRHVQEMRRIKKIEIFDSRIHDVPILLGEYNVKYTLFRKKIKISVKSFFAQVNEEFVKKLDDNITFFNFHLQDCTFLSDFEISL
jgi:hypothetical protein